MKRILILTIALIMIGGMSNVYSQMGVSVQGGLTVPTGDFGDAYDAGFGFSGTFLYRVVSQIDITGTVGYFRWSDSEEWMGYSVTHSLTTIPILGGVRFYIMTGDLSAYLAGEAGIHMVTGKVSFNGESESDTETEFGFGAGGGILFRIGDNLFLDANAKYNSINTEGHSIDFISVLVGVKIGI